MHIINIDSFKRSVPIGVIVGDIQRVSERTPLERALSNGKHLYFVVIYDLPETNRSGFNVVNGAEEHCPQVWHTLCEQGILPTDTKHTQCVFLDARGPRDGNDHNMPQFSFILLDWFKIPLSKCYTAENARWIYALPADVIKLTGLDLTEMSFLI